MTDNYSVISLKERYDLFEQQARICTEAWPEFMLHDPVSIDLEMNKGVYIEPNVWVLHEVKGE